MSKCLATCRQVDPLATCPPVPYYSTRAANITERVSLLCTSECNVVDALIPIRRLRDSISRSPYIPVMILLKRDWPWMLNLTAHRERWGTAQRRSRSSSYFARRRKRGTAPWKSFCKLTCVYDADIPCKVLCDATCRHLCTYNQPRPRSSCWLNHSHVCVPPPHSIKCFKIKQ